MEEMVEPDRTIMIVSIIGLVIIWGSFFYHKYLQDGGGNAVQQADEAIAGAGEGEEAAESQSAEGEVAKGSRKGRKGRRKR